MRKIEAKEGSVIRLGKQGENNCTQVEFDLHGWPAGTYSLKHQRATDAAPYNVTITADTAEGKAYWTVTSTDVDVPGKGKAELQCTSGGMVQKSVTFMTMA